MGLNLIYMGLFICDIQWPESLGLAVTDFHSLSPPFGGLGWVKEYRSIDTIQ